MKKIIILCVLVAFVSLWGETINLEQGETIQEAIDRAEAGDTVIVPAGTYSETILIEKDLTLQGQDDPVIEPPSDYGSANSLIIVRGDNVVDPITVTIENLIIMNSETNPIKFGVFFWENLTANFYNNTVSGFNIENGTSYGMGVICHNSTGGEVIGNTFTDNAGCLNISNCNNLIAQDNTVSEFTKWGISCSMSADCTIAGNDVTSIQEYLLSGIMVTGSSHGIDVNNNTINLPTYSLIMEGSHPDSLYSVRPYGITVSTGGDFDNVIQNNVIDGCSRCIENEGNQFGTTTITGNTIGTTVSPSFAAIFFDGGNADITMNTIADTVRSIEFVNTGNINIAENTFTGMSYDGLATINLQHDCFGSVTVNENSFDNDREVHLWNQSEIIADDEIDAGYNWWGVLNPNIKISALTAPIAPDTTWTPASPVNYTPWYMDAVMEDLVWTLDTDVSSILNPGWNLWSYNVVIEDHAIETVFAPIWSNLVKVKSILESYDPNLDPLFNTLEEIEDGHGYWINVSVIDTLELTGQKMPLTTEVQLDGGWNLIAFIPHEIYSVEDAFEVLIDNEQLLKVKSILESYDPNLDPMFNTLSELNPANGYWIKVTEALNFTYPETSVRYSPQIVEHNYLWKPIIYPNSTCAYAHIEINEGQIGAFVNGECRGVTDINQGYVSLVINGETPEYVNFKLYHNGQITDLKTTITSDPGNDVFFEFGKYIPQITCLTGAYPNPFNPVTTVSFELSEAAPVELDVYNIKGQKVETLVNNVLQAGIHNIVWSAGDQASGVYFLRLKTSDTNLSQKVILMK